MTEELKVVIALKGGWGSIGVQAPDCDPVFETLEGGLEEALGRLPGLVEEARRRWDSNPRYPKCERPLPPQAPPQSQPARPAQRQTANPRPAEDVLAQPSREGGEHMTEEEVAQLIVEWASARGGTFTDEELDCLIALLEEHFPSPETTTLEEARRALGLL